MQYINTIQSKRYIIRKFGKNILDIFKQIRYNTPRLNFEWVMNIALTSNF